jgi:hypothetical protein
MRHRRQRNSYHPAQNLDSFLDILTNTVGVLMFISLFVSLLAVEAGTIIRTPLRSPTKKEPKFFEVRNNQVFYLNDPQLNSEINQMLAAIPNCVKPEVPENIPNHLSNYYLEEVEKYSKCINNRNLYFESFYYDNAAYIVTFTPEGSLKYQAQPSAQGDTIQKIKNNQSDLEKILTQLNPDANYIAFVVRPDSFSAFRTARQKAWNLGYEVGWEPFSQNKTLVFAFFGSGGRTIGVQ